MTAHGSSAPAEYTNDYLSVTLRPADGGGETILCCFSVNLRRFDPLSRGTHGICSNPVFKGLQLLRADLSAEALARKARPRAARVQDCAAHVPRGDGWYHDSLLIENVAASHVPELLRFSVGKMIEKVLYVCTPDAALPDPLPGPEALQAFLDGLAKSR